MNFSFKIIYIFILTGVFISSCEFRNGIEVLDAAPADTTDLFPYKAEIKYARGFSVTYHNSYKKVTVSDPADPSKIYGKYILVLRGKSYYASSEEKIIQLPLQDIACVSTTHLPFITLLGLESQLSGLSGTQYVKNPVISELINKGRIEEIGFDYALDNEKIIDMSPSGIMVYPYEGMNYSILENSGIPLLFNTEYLEMDPLGKAEWIKFVSLFFNREAKANEVFERIEAEYNGLKKKTSSIKNKPTIFSGTASKDVWHIAGGRSFAAKFLRDAGCNYIWSHDAHNNIIQLDFEAVMERAIDAEWWVIVSSKPDNFSLNDLAAEDPRYTSFKAFRKKQVLFCNVNESDYFGDGVAEPHIILSDLVHFIHPGLLKEHNPRYFYRLK